MLEEAGNFVSRLASRGGQILFVGTKRAARDIIPQEAERCSMPYVSQRWLGGTLTNFATVRRSVKRLLELEAMAEDGTMDLLIKKETVKMRRELDKLEKSLGGIRNMESLPDALFVIDVGYEKIAVAEANKLGIPVVALVDTNNSPDGVDYVIPSNDDAISAVTLFTTAMADAVLAGRETMPMIEGDADEFVEEEEVRKLTERRPKAAGAKPASKARDGATSKKPAGGKAEAASGQAAGDADRPAEAAAVEADSGETPAGEFEEETKPAAKKASVKKTATGKPAAKKSTAKKAASKKTAAKKTATKKTAAKKDAEAGDEAGKAETSDKD